MEYTELECPLDKNRDRPPSGGSGDREDPGRVAYGGQAGNPIDGRSHSERTRKYRKGFEPPPLRELELEGQFHGIFLNIFP